MIRLRCSQLRWLVEATLRLNEYDLQRGVDLYHRSFQKFEVGTFLEPQPGKKKWRAAQSIEQALEKYRQLHHSSLPSRLDCVYGSFIPRSRFLGYGHLYLVRPQGAIHIADSMLIDELNEQYQSASGKYIPYDDSLIRRYWNGVEPGKGNLGDVEVLMESAQVVEVVGEKNRVQRGDVIKLPSDVTLTGVVDIRKLRGDKKISLGDGNTYVEHDEGLSMIEASPVIKSFEHDEEMQRYVVTLGSGGGMLVQSIRQSEPGDRERANYASISLSTAPDPKDGVYVMLDKQESLKLLRLAHKGRLEIA